MAQQKKKSPDFEKSLGALESLVENLEKGELSLEKTLSEFEAGIRLARECQQALADAEQKVEILLARNDSADAEPFDDN